jgi:dTDP-4-dehydrorhamnose reductase
VDHFINGLLAFVDKVEIMPKLLHISSSERNSYYTFWLGIAKVFKLPYDRIIPRYKEISGMTPRPFNSGLNSDLAKRLGIPIYSTKEGIRYMKEQLEK